MKSRFLTRFCAFLLVIIAIVSMSAVAFADESSEDDSSAAEQTEIPSTGNVLVVRNLDTGTNLKLDAGSGDRVFQAGVSARLMTALVAYEQIGNLDEKISVPFCASKSELRGAGSYIGLSYKEGNAPMTLRELLCAATISSATDACLTLAVATIRHMNGEKNDLSASYDEAAAASVKEEAYLNDFVTLMNDRAVRIGMAATFYKNCTGVTTTDSATTASDIALLAGAICTEATALYNITCQSNYTIGGSQKALYTKNALINGYNLKGYVLENAKGMMVGYMDKEDAFCVITTAEQAGLSYVFVCINTTASSEGSDGKTYVAEDSAYKTVHNFMPWALNAFKYVTVLGVDGDNADDLHAVASLPVKSGKNSSEVTIVTSHNVELLVSTDIDPETDIKVELPDFSKISLTAPISKGQVVGTAKVYLKDELVEEVTLITNNAVEESTTLAAVDKAKNFLTSPLMVKIYKWALILGGCYLLVTLLLFIYRIVRKYVSAGKGD